MITNKDRISILKSLRGSGFKGSYLQEFKKFEEGGEIKIEPDKTRVNIPRRAFIPQQAIDAFKNQPFNINDIYIDPYEEKTKIAAEDRKMQLSTKLDINDKPKPKDMTLDLSNVSGLQTFLSDKGYDIGKTGVDNILGKNTIKALQKYNRYDLNRRYGNENKSAFEYADNRDLSYVNKILNYSQKYKIVDSNNNEYRTLNDMLNLEEGVISRQLLY